MKVLFVHNRRGHIRSFVVPAPGARGSLELEPDRGQAVTEIDVPGITLTSKRPELALRKLSDIARRHRVDASGRRARLVVR
jgi:hypothetical protein